MRAPLSPIGKPFAVCSPVRAQMATAAPCATARSIWVSGLLRGSSLIALSCTFLHSHREIPHSSWRFPARAQSWPARPTPEGQRNAVFATSRSMVETRRWSEDRNRASDNEYPAYKNDQQMPRPSCQKNEVFVHFESVFLPRRGGAAAAALCCSARVFGTRRVAAVRPTEGLRFSSVLRPDFGPPPGIGFVLRIPATLSSAGSFSFSHPIIIPVSSYAFPAT